MQNSCGSTSDTRFQPINKLIHYLDLNTFKLLPCSIKMQHNHKQCQFFHYFKDRKRPGDFYSTDICEYIEKDMDCPLGDCCSKSHNRVEQLYRVGKYKARFCSYFPHNIGKCEYGDFCSFAHSEQEISIDLIHLYEMDEDFYIFHYKTVMCPFNQSKHDKGLCVYSHNWQDYRRKPNEYYYDPQPCSNWKTTDFIANYEAACKMEKNCDKCHGWKEYDFHPLNWRTKACPNGANCPKKKDCSYYHCLLEKRDVDQMVLNRVFRLIPRNRLTSNHLKKKEGHLFYQRIAEGENDSFGSNGSNNNLKENMTYSWPKNMVMNEGGCDNLNWMATIGSEKKKPQMQGFDYNLWGNNRQNIGQPHHNQHSGHATHSSQNEKINVMNNNNYFPRNFSLVNKNNNGITRSSFHPQEEENLSERKTNLMTFSNPLSFKPPGNFNPNGQNFNPNAQIFNPTSQNSNQNYAAQLQEQFFNLTKFCSESTYIPNKKNSDIDEKELLEEKDDEKLLQMTSQVNKLNFLSHNNE